MKQVGNADLKFDHFTSIADTFYRAVDPNYRSHAISGSRFAGRYSSDEQPTLYLSASLEGVEAAMSAHKANRSEKQDVMRISVTAANIVDLRDMAACSAAGIKQSDATSPWQALVAEGKKPLSWNVRDRVIQLGGKGIIDPSRQRPGLWHLVLFEWNQENAPTVMIIN